MASLLVRTEPPAAWMVVKWDSREPGGYYAQETDLTEGLARRIAYERGWEAMRMDALNAEAGR